MCGFIKNKSCFEEFISVGLTNFIWSPWASRSWWVSWSRSYTHGLLKKRFYSYIDLPAIRSSIAAISLMSNRSLIIRASSMNCVGNVCFVCSPLIGSPSTLDFLTASLYSWFFGYKDKVSSYTKHYKRSKFWLSHSHFNWIDVNICKYIGIYKVHLLSSFLGKKFSNGFEWFSLNQALIFVFIPNNVQIFSLRNF